MKIKIIATGNDQVKEYYINAGTSIYIDLAPVEKERHGPGEGNGLLGPECLVQIESNGAKGQVVGLKIIPEPGRDDSQYMENLAIPENPKV